MTVTDEELQILAKLNHLEATICLNFGCHKDVLEGLVEKARRLQKRREQKPRKVSVHGLPRRHRPQRRALHAPR